MKYIGNAIAHCGNFDVPWRSPFGIPCATPCRAGGTLLASSPFPVLYIKVSHAVCPGTILALFARGADRRSGNRRLRRTDPLSGGTDGGRDDLCPAARADVPIDRAARLAARCGGLAAVGRGGVLLPGADLAAGLDGCRARAAPYARSPPAPSPRPDTSAALVHGGVRATTCGRRATCGACSRSFRTSGSGSSAG